MSTEMKAVNRILQEGLDGVQRELHARLDRAGAGHDAHVAAVRWIEDVLLPWLQGRRDALLGDLARRVIAVESNVARVDAVERLVPERQEGEDDRVEHGPDRDAFSIGSHRIAGAATAPW